MPLIPIAIGREAFLQIPFPHQLRLSEIIK